MSLLIVGKSGFIAKYFAESEWVRREELYFTSSSGDKSAYLLDLNTPQNFDYQVIIPGMTVVLLAAISSPDYCEREFRTAYNLNVSATIRFIKGCLRQQARVIFFSSDTVYGNQKIIDDNTAAQPLGKYAEMKFAVEQAFAGEKHFKAFRMSYVFAAKDKFTTYLQKCVQDDLEAEIYHPIRRRVIFINDVIAAVESLHSNWDKHEQQVINLGGLELLSRANLAKYYQRYVDQNLKFSLVCPDASFYQARPENIDMNSLYLAQLLNRFPYTIEQAIQTAFTDRRSH